MKNITFISFVMAAVGLFSGCTATNTESSLESKAARMSPDLLRSQVLRYKAFVEQDDPAITEFFNEIVPPKDAFNPETAAKINEAMIDNPEMRETIARYTENLDRYQFFYNKFKEKGGDMTGLELETEGTVIENYYSPPIKEPSSPHSESQATEPV